MAKEATVNIRLDIDIKFIKELVTLFQEINTLPTMMERESSFSVGLGKLVEAHLVSQNLHIKRRTFTGRLIRWPGVFTGHYRLLRKVNGRRVSLIAAWRLSLILLKG